MTNRAREIWAPGRVFGGAGGLTWVNLSALASGLSSADSDPSSQASSFSSDATGTTIAVQNSVSVDGLSEGAVWVLGDITDVFPGWTQSAGFGLVIRGTILTSAPDSVVYWQAVGLAPAASYAGTSVAYVRTATADQVTTVYGTADSGGITLNETVTGVFLASSTSVRCYAQSTGTSFSSAGVLMSATRLIFAAGCESATNTGPHSAKVLWQAALVDLTP